MKGLLLNKKEFVERYGPFGFEIHPLDMNLAKMQHGLLQRIKEELFDVLEENTISETFESKNPEENYSTIVVECLRTGTQLAPYAIWLTAYDLKHERKREVKIASGNEERMMEFLNSNSFVPICKENGLYFDYEFKNYHSFRDYTDQLILRILKRAESEVPEHGDFVPLFEFFANPDIKCDIVGKYGLEIFKMPYDVQPDPTMRYLRANAYESTGNYKAGMIVGSGTKTDILTILQSEDFANDIGYTFGQLKDNLRDL